MIAHLRGRLLSKQPQQAVLEAGGVGYEVTIAIPTFEALPGEGSEISLHIHTHVREDTLALYGFLELREKRLFERLITVSGVGPKLAVTVLSGLSADPLIAAIRGGDHAVLTGVPGIGKRLAERLVVELKDKLEDLSPAAKPQVAGRFAEDALSALVNLGYPRQTAQKAIAAAVEKDKSMGDDFDRLFRAALATVRS